MKEKIIENGIEYVKRGDYYYPNVEVPKKRYPIGVYGRLHKEFIKEYRKGFYTSLILQGKLDEYIYEIDREAYNMLNDLISKYAEQEGVTEKLKAENQMLWVQRMNNIRSRVTDIVNSDFIFV
ncbi:TnpV protein [Ructibacterium gallinarum]|uniref:TnpV protein n=1 Tax=Ructibacterium gallinarum TaxID=2779355 RepID=A0A9D5R893_9FIRM|nr:TnpV protein [Ructibacterium gallinarum]MBE5039717.1 TnpV protein [Ructibacterium gallinarum]